LLYVRRGRCAVHVHRGSDVRVLHELLLQRGVACAQKAAAKAGTGHISSHTFRYTHRVLGQ